MQKFTPNKGLQGWVRRLALCVSTTYLLGAGLVYAQAQALTVAVAANFAAPMQSIAAAFALQSGHKLQLAFGSTGKLYAQIKNGAPFQLLLAADSQTPARLEKEGLALAASRFTYATGRLVLWSSKPGYVDAQGAVLRAGAFKYLALADPKLSPYGAAALQTLQAMGLESRLQSRWVVAENIAQTYQFVATGNADLGFVALSQVMQNGRMAVGSVWWVPPQLHAPLRHDAVILRAGKDHAAAKALAAYLQGDTARAIMRSYGYEH
jgi:molybdate transport system substrate-binding protein